MSRMLFAAGLVGTVLCAGLYLPNRAVDAAAPPVAQQATIPQPAQADGGLPDGSPQSPRALLDSYCVTCHNERLKTAGLVLDQVDVGQAGAHAEVLEKVVRKLRS